MLLNAVASNRFRGNLYELILILYVSEYSVYSANLINSVVCLKCICEI